MGVPPLRKGAHMQYCLYSPFPQCCRAIHAASAAYFYPSRSLLIRSLMKITAVHLFIIKKITAKQLPVFKSKKSTISEIIK